MLEINLKVRPIDGEVQYKVKDKLKATLVCNRI